jgi:hypothetical protein
MKLFTLPACIAALLTLFAMPATARAIEIRISAQALERTLNKQLFNGDQGRYYIRGKEEKGCYAYAQDPKVTFKDDRIVVHVKARAKLGASLRGECLGVAVSTEADVSVVPDAQGETIGFRDPRVENLSDFKELNFILIPFLSKKLPQQMKVNAADFVRQILSTSMQTTGYEMKLDHLKIHSMQIDGNSLVVDFDGDLSVN